MNSSGGNKEKFCRRVDESDPCLDPPSKESMGPPPPLNDLGLSKLFDEDEPLPDPFLSLADNTMGCSHLLHERGPEEVWGLGREIPRADKCEACRSYFVL